MKQTSTDHRLYGADFVRAAACLMVVAHHVAQRASPIALGPTGTNAALWVMMGAFGVSAFFVLSGYLLARPFWIAFDRGEPMPSLRTYALRRAARILPAYWLVMTITFAASVLFLGAYLERTLVLRFVAGLLLVNDWHWLTFFPIEFNGPLWSIGFEITSYVLLPVCLVAVFAARPWLGGWMARLVWAGIILALIGAQWAIMIYVHIDPLGRSWNYGLVGGAKFWMPRFNPIGFFSIFAIGALAAGAQVRVMNLRSPVFDLLALSGLGLAAWSITQHFGEPEGFGLNGVPYGFPWFPVGVGLVLLCTPSSLWIKHLSENVPVKFVARISFGIYVWHFFLMEIVRVRSVPDYVYGGMNDAGQWAWISTGVVAASVVIATLSYYLFEEPIIRWARGLERRVPRPAAPATVPTG